MITKEFLRKVNADILEAVQSVAKKHNVKISLGSCSYASADFTTKIKVALPEAEKVKGEESKQYAGLLGLPNDVVGKKFQLQGKEYEVVRLDIGKPKNPIIIKRPNTEGVTYKISVDTLKRALSIG